MALALAVTTEISEIAGKNRSTRFLFESQVSWRKTTKIMHRLAFCVAGLLIISQCNAIWPPQPTNLDARINLTFCPGQIGSLAPIQGLVSITNAPGSVRFVADVFITTDGRYWAEL